MAAPIIPLDSKTPPPVSPPSINNSLPPAYPSSYSPYPQPQQPGVLPPNAAQPQLHGPPYGTQPPPGTLSPGTLSPQHTGFGALPAQQIPIGQVPQAPYGIQPQHTGFGALPGQQVPLASMDKGQAPMNGFPPQQQQQVPMIGGYPAAQQQIPLMTGQTPAQLGAQYQAAQYAQCAMGNHSRQTKYGVLGIIGAIVFFPIGLLCLFADKEDVCTRCGQRL